MNREPRWALAAIAGAALPFWLGIGWLSGTPEPWDGAHYPVGLSAALMLVAVCAYLLPQRAWRWAAVVIGAQVPAILLRTPPGPLCAVGAGVLLLEMIPALVVATLAARLQRR